MKSALYDKTDITKAGTLYVLVFLLSIILAPRSGSASSSDTSIEALLHQSQQALMKSQSTSSEDSSSHQHKSRRRKAPDPITNAPVVQREILQSAPQTADINPIDTTALQKVISVDLEAKQRERRLIYPLAKLSVSGGVQSLRPVYSLMKDDDHFTDQGGGQLGVFYLAFNPTWRIRPLDTRFMQTFVSGALRTGYAQGNVVMQRVGVQPSSHSYGVKIFPAEIGAQIEFEFWRRIGIFGGYGPAMEVFHQDGAGVNDTVTDVFYGDEAWVGLDAWLSENTQLFVSYMYKGAKVFIKTPNFGGQIFAAGLTFNLFD